MKQLTTNRKYLGLRSSDESEFVRLLGSILQERRADAMLSGFGEAFNLFPHNDELLERHLKRLIDDHYGTYFDWATIAEALWEAIDEFRESLDEEQLIELESLLLRP